VIPYIFAAFVVSLVLTFIVSRDVTRGVYEYRQDGGFSYGSASDTDWMSIRGEWMTFLAGLMIVSVTAYLFTSTHVNVFLGLGLAIMGLFPLYAGWSMILASFFGLYTVRRIKRQLGRKNFLPSSEMRTCLKRRVQRKLLFPGRCLMMFCLTVTAMCLIGVGEQVSTHQGAKNIVQHCTDLESGDWADQMHAALGRTDLFGKTIIPRSKHYWYAGECFEWAMHYAILESAQKLRADYWYYQDDWDDRLRSFELIREGEFMLSLRYAARAGDSHLATSAFRHWYWDAWPNYTCEQAVHDPHVYWALAWHSGDKQEEFGARYQSCLRELDMRTDDGVSMADTLWDQMRYDHVLPLFATKQRRGELLPPLPN
jgi:hypothetical protein